jgi:uncharacterized hydrophobic protein (TIGR00271 family)
MSRPAPPADDATMLHVHVASPADLTSGLVDVLAVSPGVVNLIVLPGAARRPAGDAVQFDLTTAAANPVLARLRDLQPDHLGPIVINSVDAVIGSAQSGTPPAAQQSDQQSCQQSAPPPASSGRWAALRAASYHGETAPAWDLVEAKIAADSVYAPSFFTLLALAGLIGAVGILTNSTILIVGAMVVGPEYNATIAVALGIERRNWAAVRRGVLALTAGFLLAIVATLLFGLIMRGVGHVPQAYLRGVRPVSDLINSPDLFSVIVAVLAGIIGVVSLTEARSGALIGVFISVTTIPAAADIGLSLAFQNWRAARGATLQLLLNIVLLIIVGALALRAQRKFWRHRSQAGSQEDR